MKIIINDFNCKNYMIHFHPVFIWNTDENLSKNNNKFKYLFILNYSQQQQKFMITQDKNNFREFIKECIQYPMIKKSVTDFEVDVIFLISKFFDSYNNNKDENMKRKVILYMLGSLLLFNIKYKNYDYLRKLELFFSHTNTYEDECIKFLIIMMNNLNKITIEDTYDKNLLSIDMIDFAFDYYEK